MDFFKEGCRFYTFTRWKLGKKATEIRGELLQDFPESTPSLETVSRWIRAFTAGKIQLEDDHHPGCPRTSVTKATMVCARSIIDEDSTVTLQFLSLELGVSYGSAHGIMHEHLGLRKKCAQWIPHLLTEEQKSERVRICRL
ncbi:Histone-lysine N-methyltransferase SETMAR [Portunus trituberculatus]|uniref:Histone-lysine N-methyltransferase SETMAR n=1 Tax=Portunus trituberculatus TaxID=210409 RepID=A0A5B7DAV5_PORTR|nr:Histone-lysine N-methyltransferase SETMAR [Portunus trituberculatus]